MKRAFDVVAAALGLLILAPVLVLCALAVALTSKGPVVFRQVRLGRNFRPFSIYKFRTMVDSRQGAQITTNNDSRITPVGSVLRKLKLDETPQLFNVLKGDMSFVGPRPEVPRYVNLFQDDYRELLTVRPGITDPASLKYRDEQDVLGRFEDPERAYVENILPDKIRIAKEYVRRHSFGADLALIFKTFVRIAR